MRRRVRSVQALSERPEALESASIVSSNEGRSPDETPLPAAVQAMGWQGLPASP